MNRWRLVLAIVVGLTACDGGITSPIRTEAELNFLRVRVGVPALANPSVSFWAKYDSSSQARIVYHALPGLTDSVTLVDFTVPSQSIFQRPDGSRLGPGDSVQITITVVDPLRMIVSFEPSGLRFSPGKPARLKFALGTADPDLNGDGRVDETDAALQAKLHIWRQERVGDPWTQLPSSIDVMRAEVAADIAGFTRYLVAY
jgi:hypothetical protein